MQIYYFLKKISYYIMLNMDLEQKTQQNSQL